MCIRDRVKASATIAQRMQIVRDLCTVARADKKVTNAEMKVISSIAKDLEVPSHFVHQATSMEVALD